VIAICKTENQVNFTVNDVYPVYWGNYSVNDKSGHKNITELLTQDNYGSLVFAPANSFVIPVLDFSKYVIDENAFVFRGIAYDGFSSDYHDDRPERASFHKKANLALFTSKLELYEELSCEMLEHKLANAVQDEQDFIFDFLMAKQNDGYITWTINKIKKARTQGQKWYDIYKGFEYLASFHSELVTSFFEEYFIKDCWENYEINEIVYGYLGYLD